MTDNASYADLSQRLRGPVILPQDEDYDRRRRIWNQDVDRFPAAIARCLDEQDVSIAVRFAVEAGIKDVAVRGGGHSYPGLSTCDGGLVIDLGLMNAGRVGDDDHVVLQGGATLADLDALTATIGTAVPAGVEATTGVAGLTLGGGVGSLQRRFGLTCDSLRSVRMVTADGSVVVADDRTEPELMWGLRGGGGNFGVVTELEFQSYPVGQVHSSFFMFSLDKLTEFARFYDEFVVDLPKDVASCSILPKVDTAMAQTMRSVGTTTMPSGLPAESQGEFFGVNVIWVGNPDDLAAVIKPLLDWAPVAYVPQSMSHLQLQSMLPEYSVPQNRYVRGGYIESVSTGVLQDCAALFDDARPPVSTFVFLAMGGAVVDVAELDTAFPGRNSKFLYAIEASWLDPSEREATVAWVRLAHETIEKHGTGGGYTNTVTDEGSRDGDGMRGVPPREERVRQVFGDEKFARLQKLKSVWDPDNLFHLNVNIPPAHPTR